MASFLESFNITTNEKSMRKIMLAVAVLGAMSFASCKKDYTCECKKVYTGSSSSTTVNDGTYTFNDSRPRAEKKCDDEEMTGSDILGSYSRECQIK